MAKRTTSIPLSSTSQQMINCNLNAQVKSGKYACAESCNVNKVNKEAFL